MEVTDDFWRNNLGKPVDQSLLTPERPDGASPNEGLSRTGTSSTSTPSPTPRTSSLPYFAPSPTPSATEPTPYRNRMPGVPKHQAQLRSRLLKNPPTRRFKLGVRPAETIGRSAPARIGCTTGPGSTA